MVLLTPVRPWCLNSHALLWVKFCSSCHILWSLQVNDNQRWSVTKHFLFITTLSVGFRTSSVIPIITTNPASTAYNVWRVKTIQGWIREFEKQPRLYTVVLALEFACFFTNLPSVLMYFAVNHTSATCLDNVMLINICL